MRTTTQGGGSDAWSDVRQYMKDMMAGRSASLGLALITVLLALASCTREDPRVRSLRNLEPGAPSDERIRELEALVEQHGNTVAQSVDAGLRQADALKLLAQEYMRQELYGPALDALDQAIRMQPRNHMLHYLAGVSAGFIAKGQVRAQPREDYYAIAERAYLNAIELSPDYVDGLYALGVLYVFERNEPLKALPYLRRALDRSGAHIPSLFVLARAHVSLGNINQAIDAYDRIIAARVDEDTRRTAERNRRLLLGGAQ